MMRGALDLLLSSDPEAEALRQCFTFVVFPMLNPDGVAAGNGRVNIQGHDLNRCWEVVPMGSEIELVKAALQTVCSSPGGALAFLDLHAHSKRHGVFTISNPGGEELPDILAKVDATLFDRQQCTFQSEKGKRGSARSTVWREFGITHAHTVESGYAGIPDKSRLLTPQDLTHMGQCLVRGCAQLQCCKTEAKSVQVKKPGTKRKPSKKSGGPAFKLVM